MAPSREPSTSLASLRAIPLQQVGSAAWWAQRVEVERLNAAAHGAGAGAVAAALVREPGQLDALVQILLVAEGWRERVAPQLAPASDTPRFLLYLALFHEATAANLLEAALLEDAVADSASEDALFEAADYGVRAVRAGGRERRSACRATLKPLPSGAAAGTDTHGARDRKYRHVRAPSVSQHRARG
jgi:hypothetical protein